MSRHFLLTFRSLMSEERVSSEAILRSSSFGKAAMVITDASESAWNVKEFMKQTMLAVPRGGWTHRELEGEVNLYEI